jgi:hypothetical protein
MTFHSRVDVLAMDRGVQVQDRVEGVEPEEIPMGFTRRGTGAAVTVHGEAVDTLLTAARNGASPGGTCSGNCRADAGRLYTTQ